ncbi:MAG: hypothetical protein IT454_01105 [Planctomycetes bacterium]|nr:hypothetical protein [Planctomycetota bacterium]
MRTLVSALVAVCSTLGAARAQSYGPWHVLGRLEADFGKGSTAAVLAPEKVLRALEVGGAGPDLAATFEGFDKERVAWRRLSGDLGRAALDVGALDLNTLCPPPASRKGNLANAACYLYRRIDAESALEVAASLGSDDGVKLWLNGQVLVERHVARALAVQDDALTLKLVPGANHLLVKVTQLDGAYSFQIRPATRIPQTAINESIDRGVRFLLDRQLIDGSWGCWEHWGGGHAAFAAYTLLKCGVRADHPAVRMALRFTEQRPMDTTYAMACLLLALDAHGGPEVRERMQETLAQLVDVQTTSGLWDYPVYPGGDRPPMDMSNTLYAALALRAAHKHGFEVPDTLWVKMASGTLRCLAKPEMVNGDDGKKVSAAGFSYRIDGGATGSTTTAGLSVLSIAATHGGDRLPQALRTKLAEAQALGMRWIARNMAWSHNPGAGPGHHYFWVYGLERVGALYETERIGKADWYWDGADYLVKAQRDDGSWNPGNYAEHEYLDTCLALLFLKRATRPSSGEPSKAGLYETTQGDVPVALRAAGDTPLTMWVSGLSESVAKELAPTENAVLDIERIEFFGRFAADAGEPTLLGSVTGAPAKRFELQRFALRHEFGRRGRWLVRARVYARPQVLDKSATPAALRTFESPDLEVFIDGAFDARRLEYAADLGRNLLFGAKLRAESSTQASDGEAAARCADQNHATRWRCSKDDERPWVRLVLERPARADGLLLSHALPRTVHAADARASKLDIVINQKEHFAVSMRDDVLDKTEVAFGATLAVKEIEVRVLECLDRKRDQDPVGFSEIELVKSR